MTKTSQFGHMSELEDASTSDCENSEATKRPMHQSTLGLGELQHDLQNYETAASHRSQRIRKRPARFAELPTPVKRSKSQQQPAQKPRQSQSVKRLKVKPNHTSQRKKSSTSRAGLESTAILDPATAPEAAKRSLILHLRLGPPPVQPLQVDTCSKNGCGEIDIKNPSLVRKEELSDQNFGSHAHPCEEIDSRVNSLAVLPSSPVSDLDLSLNAVSRHDSTSRQSRFDEPAMLRTPEHSPNIRSQGSPRMYCAKSSRISSQGTEKTYTPPTPESLPRSTGGNRCSAAFAIPEEEEIVQPRIADHSQTVLPWKQAENDTLLTVVVPRSVPDVETVSPTHHEMASEALLNEAESIVLDQKLRATSEKLFAHRLTNYVRPDPSGRPAVWAEGRQELCETLHYYRAYQGACYSSGGFVRGFMFDKVAHPRDYTDSNVVISRAGGSLVKDKESGQMRAGRDQVEDSVAQGLRNCQRHHNPVVIITGADNPTMPSKPPHQYCVLDYFKPTHIWVEKSGGVNIVRYRFERLNTKKDPWWRPKDLPDPVELGSLPPPVSKDCIICGKDSLQVYLNGWMCLKPTCSRFWKIATPQLKPDSLTVVVEPEEAALIYDPRFLKQKTSWPNEDHDYALVSNTFQLSGYAIPGEDTSQAFWFGMVCPECGRCNSRLGWMGWECSNPTCNFKKQPPHTPIPATSLREPLWPLTDSYTLSRDIQSSHISVQVLFAHGYRINRFGIPGIKGFITHMIANKAIVEEPGGPDAMFEELQQKDIGLRRHPMPNAQLKGPNHCRHFTVNYGMPYKFIAATASRSFSEAARPITAARSRLNWAAKLLLAKENNQTMEQVSQAWKEKEFNEVLALGYFEAQKINYHDDGEHGLGPTIATLSLGAPGSMRLRMKARHYHGVSSAGVYDDAPPLPGCQQYEARLALQSSLDALKQSDSRAYTAKRKQIPKDLKLHSTGQAKDVLNMRLGHGDIVVMHGAELQRYYEHAVEHAGKLRFALTCRYIDPASLKEEDWPGYEVGPDEEEYDGARVMSE